MLGFAAGTRPATTTPGATRRMDTRYVPALDGMRAIAAIGVIVAHHGTLSGLYLVEHAGNRIGMVGVDMFFTLSGFLITGILLGCKSGCESQSLWLTIRQFYVRRSLRIFPLYYLVFFVFAVAGVSGIAGNWPWFLTYTVNFGKSVADGFSPLNHFWTLAVEEQFYLAWPLTVLLLSTRSLLGVCLGLSVFSFGFRCWGTAVGLPATAITQYTFGCLEPLCIGAAFAVANARRPIRISAVNAILVFGVACSAALFVLARDPLLYAVGRLPFALMFGAAISGLATGQYKPLGRVLSVKPLVQLGRVSYGMYVYHLPVLWMLGHYPIAVSNDLASRAINLLVILGATVLLSAASWRLFEKPINDQKRYFPYRVGLSSLDNTGEKRTLLGRING